MIENNTHLKDSPNVESAISDLIAVTAKYERFASNFQRLNSEIGKVIVGMEEQRELVLLTMIVGGHILLESTPGLAKTTLAKTFADVSGLSHNRIQFTPDLIPSDIIGFEKIVSTNGEIKFQMQKGPIFADVILADEVNRTPPKTLAAMLEAMAERQVTLAGTEHKLSELFFVIATENPIEENGTYPLPMAQIDRFLTATSIPFPSKEELVEIGRRQTTNEVATVTPVFSPDEAFGIFQEMRSTVRDVQISEEIELKTAALVSSFDPNSSGCSKIVTDNIAYPPSPRGLIAIILMAKAFAAVAGRASVQEEDLKQAVMPCLSHRLVLLPEADKDPEEIIKAVLAKVFPEEKKDK